MSSSQAMFFVGQIIHHKRFDYRGVVIDVDPEFHGTADWYKDMASSKPPKDRPWYHILVDGSDIRTYVAERNMEPDKSGEPVNHPEMTSYFSDLGSDGYIARKKGN